MRAAISYLLLILLYGACEADPVRLTAEPDASAHESVPLRYCYSARAGNQAKDGCRSSPRDAYLAGRMELDALCTCSGDPQPCMTEGEVFITPDVTDSGTWDELFERVGHAAALARFDQGVGSLVSWMHAHDDARFVDYETSLVTIRGMLGQLEQRLRSAIQASNAMASPPVTSRPDIDHASSPAAITRTATLRWQLTSLPGSCYGPELPARGHHHFKVNGVPVPTRTREIRKEEGWSLHEATFSVSLLRMRGNQIRFLLHDDALTRDCKHIKSTVHLIAPGSQPMLVFYVSTHGRHQDGNTRFEAPLAQLAPALIDRLQDLRQEIGRQQQRLCSMLGLLMDHRWPEPSGCSRGQGGPVQVSGCCSSDLTSSEHPLR